MEWELIFICGRKVMLQEIPSVWLEIRGFRFEWLVEVSATSLLIVLNAMRYCT